MIDRYNQNQIRGKRARLLFVNDFFLEINKIGFINCIFNK